ncbi:FmdB family zinc ribbon protein [Salinibacter grassmerensis]|uniref:FmdB family zinc ribbon protein n=1 Tax=Salinibacter grassmerensis TaxID=3040353 RepID=UPI0021E83B78|nr:zinc ribbon domain-containing protein [Salinibacter grassmerensis]
MPTYEYRCTDCEHDFALEASVAEYEEGLGADCPECGSSETTRRLGSVVISTGSSDPARKGGCCTPGSGCC